MKGTANEGQSPDSNQDGSLSQFNLAAAREYARQCRLEEWVYLYLNSGRWANHAFSEGLRLRKRWWNG
ncbi:MAG: hypothetical protein JSV68_20645, partial [Anaerolineaceae bacterium]